MKKFATLVFVLGFCLFSNVASAKAYDKTEPSITTTDPQSSQKTSEVKKQKHTKYDFSLFKFIAPSSVQEKDTTNKTKSTVIPKKDETVYQENPLSFFRFSYAS